MKKQKFRRNGKFFVYILECQDGTYYTGYTPDIEKRLILHNSGKGAKYTRARLPVKLAWKKEYRQFNSAFQAEILIKQLTRLQKESLVKGRRLDKVLKDAKKRGINAKNLSGPGANVRGKSLRHFPRAPRTWQPKIFIKTFG